MQSDEWVVALTDGIIVYSADAIVILDLDNDGSYQTGWSVFYGHIETRDRIAAGTAVKQATASDTPPAKAVFPAAHTFTSQEGIMGNGFPPTVPCPSSWTVGFLQELARFIMVIYRKMDNC